MDLHELLIAPIERNPESLTRLQQGSDRVATGWRQMVLRAEYAACLRMLKRSQGVDLLWTGSMPAQLERDLTESITWITIALGGGDRVRAWRGRRRYLPISRISAALRSSATSGKPYPRDALYNELERLSAFITAANPAALVVTANYDPAIRLLALAARRSGIPVALYGHGLSSTHFYLSRNDGLCTHFLCWTEEEMLGYMGAGISGDNVRIVGPLRSLGDNSAEGAPEYDLLFLGARYRNSTYLATIQRVFQDATTAGISLGYRPHPMEDPSDVLETVPQITILDCRNAIEVHLKGAGVVAGGTTTGLIEARMLGRPTIFIDDLDGVQTSEGRSHLRANSNIVTSSAALDVAQVISLVGARTHYPYPSPSEEIPKLVRTHWFGQSVNSVSAPILDDDPSIM